VKGEYLKVVGRNNDVVNVGGLKFLLSEIERVAYANSEIELATVKAMPNPITGQHVEITIQIKPGRALSVDGLREYFAANLPNHMRPRKITVGSVHVGHRYKKI
jgi:acyl-CoA synthetase (AMP-forming)/AMP-acid ligase II